jgi:hypothetical protein
MTSLKLTLSRKPFEVMISGEKYIEYRKIGKWITSRLRQNHKFVEFTNGYGADRPYFKAVLKNVYTDGNIDVVFSNGLAIQSVHPVYCIEIGAIFETRNVATDRKK